MSYLARVTYTGNGSTTGYALPFSYIATSHIQAFLGGVQTTAFTVSGNTLTFTSAPANGVVITIKRVTPTDARLVDFTDGSVLTEADLDQSADQNFYIAQEVKDTSQTQMSLTDADVWDVNNIPYLHLGHIYNKKKKAKMLVTWHEYYGLAHWLRERKLSGVGAFIVERQAIKAGDEIIAVSDHTKERLVGAGTKEERISVVNNGIDFASIINTTPDIEPYDIIFGGRHVWYKGIDLLL